MLAATLILSAVIGFSGPACSEEGKTGDRVSSTPVRISSDTMEALSAERLVVFKGDVVVREEFLLCSDELYITYGEGNEVSDIVARGNVRIFHEDRTATGGEATYDRKGKTLVLTGNPVVEQCTDMVSGDKITVYLDTDRALVESESGGRVQAVIMPQKRDCTQSSKKPPSGKDFEETRCKRPR